MIKQFYINAYSEFSDDNSGYFAPLNNIFADFDFSAGAKILFKIRRNKSKLEFTIVPQMKEAIYLDELGQTIR